MNIIKKIWTRLRCHHDYKYVRTERHDIGYGEDGIYTARFYTVDIYECRHCCKVINKNIRY